MTGKPVEIRDGKFGTYVTDGKTNGTLPDGIAPDEVSLEKALALIAAQPAKKHKKK